MLFHKHSPGIEIEFETEAEVETVRSSYEEYMARLLTLGNDGSISQHDKDVVARWDGPKRSFRGSGHTRLADKLRDFYEATDERVEAILDEPENGDRIADAARRYELGINAAHLLESIELHASMDVEWQGLEDR